MVKSWLKWHSRPSGDHQSWPSVSNSSQKDYSEYKRTGLYSYKVEHHIIGGTISSYWSLSKSSWHYCIWRNLFKEFCNTSSPPLPICERSSRCFSLCLTVGDPVDAVEHKEDWRRHPERPGVDIITESLLVLRHAGGGGQLQGIKVSSVTSPFIVSSSLSFSLEFWVYDSNETTLKEKE